MINVLIFICYRVSFLILMELVLNVMMCYNDQYFNHYHEFMIGVLIIMARHSIVTTPVLERIFAQIGQNIRAARLRRRFTADIVAQRAGITRNTLRSIERGETGVSLGAFASVLNSLGLEKDLQSIAQDDELGRKLLDAGLPMRARAPRYKYLKKNFSDDETTQYNPNKGISSKKSQSILGKVSKNKRKK